MSGVVFVLGLLVVSGLLFLLLAAARMGWISRFLSKAVITGDKTQIEVQFKPPHGTKRLVMRYAAVTKL